MNPVFAAGMEREEHFGKTCTANPNSRRNFPGAMGVLLVVPLWATWRIPPSSGNLAIHAHFSKRLSQFVFVSEDDCLVPDEAYALPERLRRLDDLVHRPRPW
jgi:hypothetical protein